MKKPGKTLWLNVIHWNPMQPHFSFTNKKNITAYFTYLNWFILFRLACRLHSFALHSNSIFWSSMFLSFSFAVTPRIIILHFCLSHCVKISTFISWNIVSILAKKNCFNEHQCYVQLSSSRFLYYVVTHNLWVSRSVRLG